MTSFYSLLNPSMQGLVFEVLEDFKVAATLGGAAALYPGRYHHGTELPRNLHAALAATSLGVSSLDYARRRYAQGTASEVEDPAHLKYMAAYRKSKSHIGSVASQFESNSQVNLRLGTYAAEVALQRLPGAFFATHLLYQLGLHYEGDSVARHILEQIAWAVAADPTDDETQLLKLRGQKAITSLGRLAPFAGAFYGELSATTHASLQHHRHLFRNHDTSPSIAITWQRASRSAYNLLRLTDLWAIAYEWTQRDHMKRFSALSQPGHELLAGRIFWKESAELVKQIEADEQRAQDAASFSPGAEGAARDLIDSPRLPPGEDWGTWESLLEAFHSPPDFEADHRRIFKRYSFLRSELLTSDPSTSGLDVHLVKQFESGCDLREWVNRIAARPRRDPVRPLTFSPGYRFITPWLQGISLGPLSDLRVYSTDAHDRWTRKAHAPGHCHHSERLGPSDDSLPLEAWVNLYREKNSSSDASMWLCHKCGGFAANLLTDQQVTHYAYASRLAHEFEEMRWHRRNDVPLQPGALVSSLRAVSNIAKACPDLKENCLAFARESTLAQ